MRNLITRLREWKNRNTKAAALSTAISTAAIGTTSAAGVALPTEAAAVDATNPTGRYDVLVSHNKVDSDFLVIGTLPYGGDVIVRDVARADAPYGGQEGYAVNFALIRIETAKWHGFRLGLEQQHIQVITDPSVSIHNYWPALVWSGNAGPVGLFSETVGNHTGAWEQVLMATTPSDSPMQASLEGVLTMQAGTPQLVSTFARLGYRVNNLVTLGVGMNTVTARVEPEKETEATRTQKRTEVTYETRWHPGAYVQFNFDAL
jgi:hypothetical protein